MISSPSVNNNRKPSSKLGWPHQRGHAISDGVVSRYIDFANLVMTFGTHKLECIYCGPNFAILVR